MQPSSLSLCLSLFWVKAILLFSRQRICQSIFLGEELYGLRGTAIIMKEYYNYLRSLFYMKESFKYVQMLKNFLPSSCVCVLILSERLNLRLAERFCVCVLHFVGPTDENAGITFYSFFFLFYWDPCFYQCTIHTSKISGGQCTPVGPMHYSRDPQTLLFNNFFIKNEFHGTIHTFKNYFATVFSIFSKINNIQTHS